MKICFSAVLCLLIGISFNAFADLSVGTFTDINGLPYTRTKGTLGGETVFREVYSDGRAVLKNSKGAFVSGQGKTFVPDGPAPAPVGPAATTVRASTNVAGVVGGALSLATGVVTSYDALSEKDRKTTWGDVGQATIGGAMTTGGAALIFNSIPVGGQIAYGASVAVGAAAGFVAGGLKMFSETDCAEDAVLSAHKGFKVYQCCHTSKRLSTIKNANYWDIGAHMFCPQPGMVSQCVQREYRTGIVHGTDQGVRGLVMDDMWNTCKERWCPGYSKPAEGLVVQYYADYDNYCWLWKEVTPTPTPTPDPKPNPKPKPNKKTCDTKYPVNKNPEANACCQKRGLDAWKNGSCVCDDGYEWSSEQKDCVSVNQTSHKCDLSCDIQVECYGKVTKYNEQITTFVKDDKECKQTMANSSKSCQEEFARVKDNWCAEKINLEQISLNDDKVKKAVAVLDGFNGDVSKWKNAEGEFNTARLASDLTAGVVLGTVGGVVSGVVIKKKQLEKGFDALHCTVGGQIVADWGDDFSVGLR